jgi:deoxyribodipyrimidine photo-lyase
MPMLKDPPPRPSDTPSAHPFQGGSASGHNRLAHFISSGSVTHYKDSRNGLLGMDFSTKLSAWLALGCLTARQVHSELLRFEDGCNDEWKLVEGYGKGENSGTAAVRFELLWRDYMRLCTRKFGSRLFRVSGFRGDESYPWKTPRKGPMIGNGYCNANGHATGNGSSTLRTEEMLRRFLSGTTGTGLIDASQRELLHTGYTSHRARQNVASYLAKHLGINWMLGAEWYECMLIDYDVSSNWGNWQYVAGVGNDPRGEARVFNPIKQACDYDPHGEYVMAWVPELRGLDDTQIVFQAWKMDEEERKRRGLDGVDWVEHPLKKIDFRVGSGRRGGSSHGGGGQYGGSSKSKTNAGGGGGGGGGGRGRGGGSIGSRGGYRGRGRGRGEEDRRGQT